MEKVFRDPVHNLIRFDKEQDKLVLDLIEAREFQRLRWIKLMGVSYVVYPGAEHSRFSHSLATCYLMKRVIERMGKLKKDPRFKKVVAQLEELKEVLMCAALLHDLGHFPFSHLLEEFIGARHEDWTVKIITDPSTEVYQKLASIDSSYPQRIKEIIQRTFKPSFAVKLISSQLDVDRMDYLLRDSYYTGVDYGRFDLDWLIHALRIIEVDGDYELGIDLSKGSHVAEAYVLARYYMYEQVYYHKTSRAAGCMVNLILKRAAELLKQNKNKGKDKWIFITEPLRKLLTEYKRLSLPEYLELNDNVLLFAFKEWAKGPDPILKDLCQRLLQRRIFKTVEIDAKKYPAWQDKVYKIAERAGFKPQYYIMVDRAADNPYVDYLLGSGLTVGENIFLVDEDMQLIELAAYSELIAAIRNKTFSVDRLCFPEELREDITELLTKA